jgi:Ribbon-helix-helix protein, copG family
MAERITVRLDDEVYGRLADAAKAGGLDLSALVRQALAGYLDHQGSGPTVLDAKTSNRAECVSHTPNDCAMTIVRRCLPEVQATIHHSAEQLDLPLAEVLARLLVLVVNNQPVVLPPHGPEECARMVLAQCRPVVQTRMAEAMARTGAPLMRLLPDILQFWTDATRNPRAWTPNA